jgi:hypothetical protein
MTIGTKDIEGEGNEAVRKLRINRLKHGKSFMINSKDLPDRQCYLEYPGGKIVLVTISESSRDFHILRELSFEESSNLRKRYKLEFI